MAALALPVIEVQAVLTYIGGNWPELGFLEERAGITVLSWPRGILVGFVLLFVFFLLNSFGAKLLRDRKSTRLNSSHANISYAVFCLKKNNSNDTSVQL